MCFHREEANPAIKDTHHMPIGPDTYISMTALYDYPGNVEGTTYAKRWKRHEWSQTVEEQPTVTLKHKHRPGSPWGRYRERHKRNCPRCRWLPSGHADSGSHGHAMHDFWLFEGLLPSGNGRLHVTASHYDDPIATELVKNAWRCISLHGCTDGQAKGNIQTGGRDHGCRDIVLEELITARIPARSATDPILDGDLPDNIANQTKIRGCVQLEMGTTYRASLFGTDTRVQRKHTTNRSSGGWSGLCERQ